jgi:hypothetical protein
MALGAASVLPSQMPACLMARLPIPLTERAVSRTSRRQINALSEAFERDRLAPALAVPRTFAA